MLMQPRDFQHISPITVSANAITKHYDSQQNNVNPPESEMQLTKTV